jgi:hypothetical protein
LGETGNPKKKDIRISPRPVGRLNDPVRVKVTRGQQDAEESEAGENPKLF